MKKLFTLIGALLLWQTMAVAQNFLHIIVDDSTKMMVPTAELDSVTVRDWDFYGYDWEYLCTGKYTYNMFLTGELDDHSIYRKRLNKEGTLWQYQVADWYYGNPLVIDYDATTGRCYVQPQLTGYFHEEYGDVWIADGNYYKQYIAQDTTEVGTQFSVYNESLKQFELYVVYYVQAGRWGYGYEYLQLNEEGSNPTRARMKKGTEPEIKSMELVPFEAARKVEQQAPAMVEMKVNMKQYEPKGAPKANKGTAAPMQLKMAPKNDIIK